MMLSLEDIQAAYHRIAPWVVHTPVLSVPLLNQMLGASLYFKAESLQTTGSFKYRGATNFLLQLTDAERKCGVVAYSSGNHAQAVAAAAHRFGVSAKIVMPSDAPAIKIAGTRAWGGEVILYDRLTQSREAIAEGIAQHEGRTLVPPFDHAWTMAGQGTAGVEFAEQLAKQAVLLDILLVPCSGGGLTAGVSTAFRALSPATQVIAVEPDGYDDTRQSFQAGTIQRITPQQPTLCDALALHQPGQQTFPVLQRTLTDVWAVSDQATLQAMALIVRHLKLVVEPGGAVGLAAVLSNPTHFAGKTVGIVLSGANVDPSLMAHCLQATASQV